ncbi:hypothetical protein D3C85_1484900 [compost metagenome]
MNGCREAREESGINIDGVDNSKLLSAREKLYFFFSYKLNCLHIFHVLRSDGSEEANIGLDKSSHVIHVTRVIDAVFQY